MAARMSLPLMLRWQVLSMPVAYWRTGGVHILNMIFMGLPLERPKSVSFTGARHISGDDGETPARRWRGMNCPATCWLEENIVPLGSGIMSGGGGIGLGLAEN